MVVGFPRFWVKGHISSVRGGAAGDSSWNIDYEVSTKLLSSTNLQRIACALSLSTRTINILVACFSGLKFQRHRRFSYRSIVNANLRPVRVGSEVNHD